jgi:hypothetical protein
MDEVCNAYAERKVLGVEQVLVRRKLEFLGENPDLVRSGSLVYTHYVEGILGPVVECMKRLDFKVGTFTGRNSPELNERNKLDFIAGRTDVLVASEPVGTGVDGLQYRCNRLVLLSVPWTGAALEQLEGRICRQGSGFERYDVIYPVVKIKRPLLAGEAGDFWSNREADLKGEPPTRIWSWDETRWLKLKYKMDLASAAVDGRPFEPEQYSEQELLARSVDALHRWIKRLEDSAG